MLIGVAVNNGELQISRFNVLCYWCVLCLYVIMFHMIVFAYWLDVLYFEGKALNMKWFTMMFVYIFMYTLLICLLLPSSI